MNKGDVKTFQFIISFRQFLRSEDQLAYSIYFYKNGVASGIYEKFNVLNESRHIEEGNDEKIPKITTELTIPQSIINKYKPNSQFLIVSALSLGKDKFYPAVLNNKHRFLGACVDVHHVTTTTVTRIGKGTSVEFNQSNITISPLAELLAGKAWGN